MLDMISRSIPNDWKIYYKEHPAIFLGAGKGALRRDRYFYDKVNAYDNLKIVPSGIDTFSLIDGSQMVASPAGTVTWEAVVRGKPSMFFGRAWFQGCKSLFHVSTYQDCIDAVEKVRNGYLPDQKDVDKYAMAVHKASKKILIRDFAERIKECSDPKHEMERIGEFLHEAYEQYYDSANYDKIKNKRAQGKSLLQPQERY